MRIIAGAAKGRRLSTPRDRRIRPTSDRVKESLFNILNVRLESFKELRVLDLFAGTGNLGIEALSRGASEALFIDENREAADLIRKNLVATGMAGRGKIIQKEVLSVLKTLGEGPLYDIIFLDPPYGMNLVPKALEVLHSLLSGPEAIVVAETAARETVPDEAGYLKQVDRRTYGDTALTFYRFAG